MGFDLADVKRRLLITYPQFGSTLASLKFVEDETCIDYNGNKTIATTGEAIYYHPDFMNSVNVSQQVALFAHEIAHIELDHIFRSKGKDPETWNRACDAVINANLKHDGLELVPGMVEIEGAIDYDAESLYDKLINDKSKQQQNGEGNDNNNSKKVDENGKFNPPGSHDKWKDVVANKKQSGTKKEGKSNSKVNEKDIFQKNRELKKELLKDLKKESIRNSQAGNGSGANRINIENIGNSQKIINWKVLLRNACKVDMDWSFKNATLEYGVVTPHLENISMPLTEILLDTSGSINEELLRNFLRECKNILKQSKIKVGCFDTRFYGFTEIRRENDIEKLPIVGGGGTDFNVCVNSFSRNAENKIIFTDGYSSMPTKKEKIIWIVFGGRKIEPPGGKVIYIDEKDLQRVRNINNESQSLKRR